MPHFGGWALSWRVFMLHGSLQRPRASTGAPRDHLLNAFTQPPAVHTPKKCVIVGPPVIHHDGGASNGSASFPIPVMTRLTVGVEDHVCVVFIVHTTPAYTYKTTTFIKSDVLPNLVPRSLQIDGHPAGPSPPPPVSPAQCRPSKSPKK